MEEELQPIKRKRRRKRRFRLRGIIFLLLVAVLAIGAYAFIQFRSGVSLADNSEQEPVTFDGDAANGDYENILVLGVDSRGEEQSRTDTMMLATHDKVNGEIKLTSFMRDIYADIPGYQSYKLNTAYYLGGVDLLAETLRDMFGVEIHHYALIDFSSFESLVDVAAPNGVEIDVEKAMSKQIGVSLTPGVQNLNGKELLGYARFRADQEGDFGRVRRQQQVIAAMKDELVSLTAIPKYPKLAGALQGYVQTDMPLTDQVKLATQLATGGSEEVQRLTLPVENSYSYGNYSHAGSVLDIDIEQNRQALREYLSQPLD
ncbi:regulatory protein [Planococcus antarcticus DSM 14505]|uniref:Regulatory protein MsrR n=1 Tax=Planococcus antarcticus DSM 14505 TaxID=1185653 RepID=A0A1C7DHB5_9BACL|nr:LCP family protein [Planococcus antarcticus]ANU10802.1 transcriptional regulator [Planococcus antarcticus DSM 14505]EIM05131.1 regulatory protein [Planococcus antarcticus DSM 14505]